MSEQDQASSEARRWRVSRRGFLIGGGVLGGALALGISVGLPEAQYRIANYLDTSAGIPSRVSEDPLLWFEIAPDNRVTLFLPKVEMGQGIHTALAQIAADELELPWGSIAVRQASSLTGPPGDSGTQGSASVSGSFGPLRRAAATLREMLRAEAARHLELPAATLIARDGGFAAQDDPARWVSYGELASGDVVWEVPEEAAPLKPATNYKIIGTSQPRVDIPAKVTGAAQYGMDARMEGMLYGAVARPPTLTAQMGQLQNGAAVRAMPGVVALVEEEDFVGVVARTRRGPRVTRWRSPGARASAGSRPRSTRS